MNFQTLFTEHQMCLRGCSVTGQPKLCKGEHRIYFLSQPSAIPAGSGKKWWDGY